MKIQLVLAGFLALGYVFLLSAGCAREQVEADLPTVGRSPVKVSLTTVDDRDGISVNPEIVILERGQKLTWEVTGAESGDEIDIEFAPNENRPGQRGGPFPPQPGSERGRHSRQGNGPISTEPEDVSGPSAWKYEVRWRNAVLDPWVIIR